MNVLRSVVVGSEPARRIGVPPVPRQRTATAQGPSSGEPDGLNLAPKHAEKHVEPGDVA